MPATDSVQNIGRVGHLSLEYERQGNRTILARSRGNSPWHLLPSMVLDDSGAAYTLLLNPSGGLVGGDHLEIKARLGPDTHVLISTPSANRVYRSLKPAAQRVLLQVGAGASLEWIPDLTIPFKGADFHQQIEVTLEPGSTVVCWDALASGRVACGERWSFSSLQNEVKIAGSFVMPIVERFRLQGRQIQTALISEWDYVGSLYLAGDGVATAVWKSLDEQIVDALDALPGILAGMSEPSAGGRVVKILGRGASEFQAAFEAAWRIVRNGLWGLPAADLRRY